MAADLAPSFSSLFDSQFSFGKDGKLTGRLGLNVLDDLIAGIDELWAAAASRRSLVLSGRRPRPACGPGDAAPHLSTAQVLRTA
jgi:hypothetical protein